MNEAQLDKVQPLTINRDQQTQFLRRLFLFCLPMVVVTLPALLILRVTGEALCDIDQVVKQLPVKEYLIGFAYNEQNYPYLKFATMAAGRKAKVLTLGSSRVLSFRQGMFSTSFYNAGYTIQTAGDFQRFLQLLPEDQHPEVLVIGLDQWMFNTQWCSQAAKSADSKWAVNPSVDVRSAVRRIPKVYTDSLRGRIPIGSVLSQRTDGVVCFGLNAVVNEKGFRNDGSFDYGQQIQQLLKRDPRVSDFEFSETLARVEHGRDRFQFGDTPDTSTLKDVRQLLTFCREHEIHCVAFLPPFADRVYAAMQESRQHSYLVKLPLVLKELFKDSDAEYYDFSSMKLFGSSDKEAIDGFHAGEVAYLKILKAMVNNGSRLSAYCDLKRIETDLNATLNSYEVYPD